MCYVGKLPRTKLPCPRRLRGMLYQGFQCTYIFLRPKLRSQFLPVDQVRSNKFQMNIHLHDDIDINCK